MLKNEEDIKMLIKRDEFMMEILQAASTLNLSDWWICAGFVRSKIWDTLHDFPQRTDTPDVDVIYFDSTNVEEDIEKVFEKKLMSIMPTIPWSVKNQARMHTINNLPPYTSSVDAISKFPETATALGVKLDSNHQLVLTAPCGIEDVISLELKPTPFFTLTTERAVIYEERIIKKNWKSTWYKIKVHHLLNY
jgi:uncharacterized protein